MEKKKVWLSWSGGKDSAYTLYELNHTTDVEVAGLFTCLNEAAQRVTMHGVRRKLLELQAHSLNLPLFIVNLPPKCSNKIYDARTLEAYHQLHSRGATHVAFGDMVLEDIREYRESLITQSPLEAIFPLWGRSTYEVAQAIIQHGFKAIVTVVDTSRLSEDFSGRAFDLDFLKELPEGIDPCGENGEFHTFVYDGPLFSQPIAFQPSEVLESHNLLYLDLLAT